jgi:hypothetical protein
MERKAMGSIDVEEERDFWRATGSEDIQVFEDLKVKTRAIGFIWPEQPKLIVVEE